MIENNKLSLVGWTFFAGLVAAVVIGVIFYWFYPGSKHSQEYVLVTFFENGAYVHYTLKGREIERAPLATSSEAYIARYPSGAGLTVTDNGLVHVASDNKTMTTLIEREGLAQDAWSISSSGDYVALFNQATGSYDVFEVQYQGASVSYIGSITQPELPIYTVSIGFAGNSKIVLRTGNPEAFEVYTIKQGKVHHAYQALLKTISE